MVRPSCLTKACRWRTEAQERSVGINREIVGDLQNVIMIHIGSKKSSMALNSLMEESLHE